MAHLEVSGLRKSYGELEVVGGLDLELEPGVCFGLLGPNGAGKTTTLRLCLGLTEPDGGSITMLGLPVPARAREARSRIGVVPQVDNLDPDFTVRENLLVYGRYFGLRTREVEAKVPALLEFAGLTARETSRIQTLSGGMKRRLTLARALVNDPELVFLDEPTTGLDPQARHVIWERLRQLTSDGKTILLTTHFMDEAERLADRLAIMDHGSVLVSGTPRQLIASLGGDHVVEFETDAVLTADELAQLPSVTRVELSAGNPRLATREPHLTVPALLQLIEFRQGHLNALNTHHATLDDVFLALTGRQLRDA